MSAVELRDVYKSYPIARSGAKRSLLQFGRERSNRTQMALRNVTADIPAGAATGIVGDNGAGKSTLLRVIAGVTTPTSGVVVRNVAATGLMNLGSGVQGVLTGRENAQTIAMLAGLSGDQAEAVLSDINAYAQLGAAFDQPVRTYSSGMRMRLVFSSLVHARPQLLLLDEVLGVGDRWFRPQCRETLTDMCRDDRVTVIFTSHEPGAVRELCDYAIWLDMGRMVVSGPADEVMDEYESAAAPPERARRTSTGSSAAAVPASADIVEVSFADGSGQQRQSFVPEEQLDVRVRIRTDAAVTDWVAHVGVLDDAGQQVWETSSAGSAIAGEVLDSESHMSISFSRIGLPPGSYELSLTLFTGDWSRRLASRRRMDTFEVATSAGAIQGQPSPPAWKLLGRTAAAVPASTPSLIVVVGEEFTGADHVAALLGQFGRLAAIQSPVAVNDLNSSLAKFSSRNADEIPVMAIRLETASDADTWLSSIAHYLPDAAFIVAFRRDLLAQFIEKTASGSRGRFGVLRGRVKLDVSEFVDFCDESHTRYSDLLSALAARDARTYVVEHDLVVGEPKALLDELLRPAFDLPRTAIATTRPPAKRLNQKVSNPAVVSGLRDEPWARHHIEPTIDVRNDNHDILDVGLVGGR